MTPPGSFVGETSFGDRYELMLVEAGLDERVATVLLDVGGSPEDEPEGSLRLLPDEARALAAELVRWAGHAERAARS